MDPVETLVTNLNELLEAVRRGEIDDVKKIVDWFEQDVDRNRTLLPAVYAGARPCPTQDDLVIAACSHNQKRVLDYLLIETDILEYLTDSTQHITQVIEKRTEAVRHALRLEDFEMVEKLYNYWSGDLYWNGHEKDKFKNLGKILQDAENPAIVRDQQLLINFKSLVTLNDFQRELYNNLPQPLSHDAPAEDTARVLLTVLSIYDKYSDIDRVRIPDVTHKIELLLKSYFEDKSSTYFRALAYIKYEVYFRKLDFNIALLLLEKLYIIRNHLIKRFNKTKAYFENNKKLHNQYISASSSYKDIECAIYHLIYRTSEDWRLYLPADRQLTVETHHLGFYNGSIIRKLKTSYDIHKLYNGPVLYFERRYFKKSVNKLKKILKKHVIDKDPTMTSMTRSNQKNLEILLDVNYLTPVMYMSEHYSLRKIVTYIEALEQTTNADVIMIERVLQVIGEMLKNSPESSHISDFTKALLQTAISTDTIKHLQDIREFLSHTDKGQLSIRIDIENNKADMLLNVKDELVKIKEQIVPILDLCKSVLDKSLLQKGLDLLNIRIKNLPDGARQRLNEIHSLYKVRGNDLVSVSGQYFREVWKPAGLSHQLLKEIPLLLQNRDDISSKKNMVEKDIEDKIVRILPMFIQNTRQILKRMHENNDNVDNINSMLVKHKIKILNYSPEMSDIKDRQRKLEKRMRQCVNFPIEDLSRHWKAIVILIYNCLNNFNTFSAVRQFNFNKGSSPDESTIATLNTILEKVDVVCSMRNSTLAWLCGKHLVEWGLWIYRLFRQVFRTQTTSFPAIERLHKNTVCKVAQPSELTKCLINRVYLLRNTLSYPQQIPLREHVQRYKRDPEFRFVLEMLLSDIENIINNNKHNSRKSGKLLEGIVLGNVLDHGNPFLEVIGDIFDCHELSRELLSKAKNFAEDQNTVQALYALF
ncbi:uncharacterized protein LOC111359047 [Spodoptera litura]|uniref:Uncharacterized protein LOC111359047 n=1 Tax=Spodoptera litura TaxID=69820 RepID=A0A9J7ELY2_SPOLT|nr:uncharacterized protein LOC111359047 [Spodoptera litura]